MLKIDFLVFYYMETVGVKWPGLKDTNFKLSDTLLEMQLIAILTAAKEHMYCSNYDGDDNDETVDADVDDVGNDDKDDDAGDDYKMKIMIMMMVKDKDLQKDNEDVAHDNDNNVDDDGERS